VVVGGGFRCLVSVVGYCRPSRRTSDYLGVLGAFVSQLIATSPTRPDPNDPTETDPVVLVRSLRPSCWRSDVIGSFLVAHIEQPDELPRHLGAGRWEGVVRVCRSRWAFLAIARSLP